jgi:hypothetical protein
MVVHRGIPLAGAILAAFAIGPAWAQQNFDSGKTPAELYASDCAICHKTSRGMTKVGGIFGLTGFLREHYTASREAAAAIAAYVASVDSGPPPRQYNSHRRSAKGGDKGKAGKSDKAKVEQSKSEPAKSTEPKAAGPKAGEAQTRESKPPEANPPETKQTATKQLESKPGESKAGEAKSTKSKPAEARAEPKHAPPKDAKPEKTD